MRFPGATVAVALTLGIFQESGAVVVLGPEHSAELDFDVTVIGAGAAGMMCAAIAGQRGRRVVLVEHALQSSARRSACSARRALQLHREHRALS